MTKITLEPAADTRTPEQIAAARPIAIPAGGYDVVDLAKATNHAAALKDEERRATALDKAFDVNETRTDNTGLPGYRRVDVVDAELGVTESRLVAAPDEEAKEHAQAPASDPPAKPAASEKD